ncbi:TPA: DUF87 domain-containing protein [Candidatus Woesearchaeota archaeon]|nr:DUF87 domain-containing protein [Candidatus Woesearchaeota archaeon]
MSAYGSTNFTDENGNFTIRVYRGTHNFVGVKAGYGTYVANLTVSGGYYTTHNFTLQPISAAYDNGTISGYVTNNLTGDPLENVTIYLDTKQATTGTLGNYSMTDITYGDHTFYAIKQGFETYVGNLSMPAMGNITFNFTLDPFYGEFRRNGTLKGAVYDAKTGIGLANATIDALIYNTTTNSSGEYEFSLPAQDYLILAHKDGYNDLVRKTTITESNTSTLTFFLSNITGLVQEQELILNLSANIPTLVNFSGNFSLVMYITATENIIDAKIDLRKYTENPATTPIPDFSLVGNYLEISTNINTSTISSVTYVFTYNESLIPAPYNESSVGLYLFVENSSSWDTQTILRDETQNTLSYTTDHFSIYVPGMIRPMIQGIVTDAETNDLLSNVTVSIAGLITSTNATGNYFLEFSAGTHYLIAFKDGYESSVNLSTYNESYNYTTNIALTPIKIDQAPAVVIQQQQSSQRQRPPTTQQPRQMVVEEAKVDYYISPSEIKQKLRLGSFAEKTVSVYNFMQRDMELVLDVAGDVAPYISLSTTTVVVPKLSRGEFVVRLLGNDLGNFDGTLTFSRAFDYEMPITLNVTDQEVEVNALMLRTDVMKKEVRKGKKLRYKVDLRNLLTDQEYDVRLNFTIQDINRTVLAILAPQETRLKTFTTLLGEYDIPKDFETGEYILNVEANYFDFTSSASALFEVTTSPLQYKLFGAIPVWVVLLLIVLGAVGYLAFVIIKKKQEAAKRFHVQVDYDTLPPKGPRNIFVGKVAETTKMTYFDMDKLTVHSIVAGSTGGGKSISAQVVIEECLLKGVAVIIFDPTAQWTGMLRKCVDKHFLSLYPEFGMKPTDARAFPGNIKVIKDYREKIDVFSFAKPGEVWVVTVNRLPAKDYDKFVEATIKQVFRSNLKEKRQLEYLFVFDEIHRILPKFGGSGGGFIQIERCCREFRKWGIGIILVSQVLADFVGQIKANINTEIQMKTRDEEDMERIRMKYGEQYVQGSIKAPVGSGMVQNSAWNNGKPYFVQFRPIMHSVERLTDDELELYAKYNDIVWDLEYGLKQLEEMGQDVFDLKLELKLASDKIKSGNFNMVKIYLEGLTPRIDAFWKKIGKTPKKREIELYTDEGEVKKPEEKPAEPAANSPPGANPPEKKEWDILVLQAEEALKKGDKATAQGCYQKIFELYKNAPADAKNDIYQKANALKAKLG